MGIRAKRPGAKRPRANGNKGETTQGRTGFRAKRPGFGISGSLLSWFSSYLSNRRKCVTLPGVYSHWKYIKTGVHQGSILGPLLFLLYINDIVNDIGSHIRLFADHTRLYIVVGNPDDAAELLNADLRKITTWVEQWLVMFNPPKTESMLISRKIIKPVHPPPPPPPPYIFIRNQEITEVSFHKYLGIFFSNDCTRHKHVDYIKENAWKRVNFMCRLKLQPDRKALKEILFYKADSLVSMEMKFGLIVRNTKRMNLNRFS